MRRLGGGAATLLLGALMWVVVSGLPRVGQGSGAVRVTSESPLTDVIRLAASEASPPLIYDDDTPPSAGVATALGAAAASGQDVTLLVPGTTPALSARLAPGLTAMRRTALTVTLSGSTASGPVIVEDASGGLDTLTLPEPLDGVVTVSAAVEPTRMGVATWRVRSGPDEVRLRAWARPAADVRVLVLTGLPDWESRYLIRALESAGMSVDVRQELGRDLAVVSGTTGAPTTHSELSDVDVVALTSVPTDDLGRLLEDWVTSTGGGLLRLQRPGFGSAPDGPSAMPTAARDLQWTGPVEIVPLPDGDRVDELDVTAWTLESSVGDGTPVASSPAGVVASARWQGRGRVYTSGVETWPWVMQAGLTREHAAHWESVIEWLAGGLRSSTELSGPAGVSGMVWDGRLHGPNAPGPFLVSGPDPSATGVGTPTEGGPAPLTLESDRWPGQRVRFVPRTAGGYTLGDDEQHGVAVMGADQPLSWSQAATTLGGVGGSVSARDTDAGDATSPTSIAPRTSRRLLFLTVVAAMLTMWITERLWRTRAE